MKAEAGFPGCKGNSEGVASYSEDLLWQLGDNQRLSSSKTSPLVRQENPEEQVYETEYALDWSSGSHQASKSQSVETLRRASHGASDEGEGWIMVETRPIEV